VVKAKAIVTESAKVREGNPMLRARSRNIRPIRFTRRGVVKLTAKGQRPIARGEAAVCRVNFMVKLLRAHGGCLGRSRR
jgi:hypothetical protein